MPDGLGFLQGRGVLLSLVLGPHLLSHWKDLTRYGASAGVIHLFPSRHLSSPDGMCVSGSCASSGIQHHGARSLEFRSAFKSQFLDGALGPQNGRGREGAREEEEIVLRLNSCGDTATCRSSSWMFICFLFTATSAACGASRARGRIGAAAVRLHHNHSNEDPSCICDLRHSSQQHQVLNPPSEAGDQTSSSWTLCWVLNLPSPTGTPLLEV